MCTSNLPNFSIDATADGLSCVNIGTKPFVMKRFTMAGVAVLLVFFALSCTKQRAGTSERTGNLADTWNIVVDSSYQGAGASNHLVTYEGVAGDYFEFTDNGNVYTKEGPVFDTLTYTVLADSVHIIISGFGAIFNGVQDTSVISDHSATSMTITSFEFLTPGGIFWRKVVLSR
jgi:hypothetical protein